jgi:hypothetical protein
MQWSCDAFLGEESNFKPASTNLTSTQEVINSFGLLAKNFVIQNRTLVNIRKILKGTTLLEKSDISPE